MENRIVVNYGEDIRKMTMECLDFYGAAKLIKPRQKVLIKPNLVNATVASQGATTHPGVVEGIIDYLHENGHEDIEIIDSSWVGGNTAESFKVCGYTGLSKKYGIDLTNIIDGGFKHAFFDGVSMEITDKVFEGAFLINVPVMKAHCQTTVTCCIKNLKGLIPNAEKRSFHTQGLHKPIAALGALIKTGFNVVDGFCGDLTFEEGGNPVQTNMIFVGEDPLLLDTYAAEFMGYNPNEIEYMQLAKKHNVGLFYSDETNIQLLNDDKKTRQKMTPSKIAANLGKYINEKDSCSACYSALIHALHNTDKRLIDKCLNEKVSIGQGFKEQQGQGIGFGNCTLKFETCIKGCPPKALDFINYIKQENY